jgi:hypothetical protein
VRYRSLLASHPWPRQCGNQEISPIKSFIANLDLSLCKCPSGTSLSTRTLPGCHRCVATQEEKEIISPIECFITTVVPLAGRSMKIGSGLPQLSPDSQAKGTISPIERFMANLCQNHSIRNPSLDAPLVVKLTSASLPLDRPGGFFANRIFHSYLLRYFLLPVSAGT